MREISQLVVTVAGISCESRMHWREKTARRGDEDGDGEEERGESWEDFNEADRGEAQK